MVAPAALALLASASSSIVPHGYADCPCVDPFPLAGPGTDANATCSGLYRDEACYERGYGTKGCRMYDAAASEECQQADPPAFCRDQWCWVAPWDCLKPHAASSFFKGVVIDNSTLLSEGGWNGTDGSTCGDGDASRLLTYSYETCGNVDSFTYAEGVESYLSEVSMRGKLRISIPGDEPPYLTTAQPNATDWVHGTARRDGSVVRFVDRVLTDLGMEWVVVPISAASRAFSPDSSFTACVHDVALNSTDICVGSVWPFEHRRRLTHFTSSLQSLGMHLVVKVKPPGESRTFVSLLSRPFSPFDMGMWMGLLGALMYAGYALYTLDASGYESDDDDDDDDSQAAVPASSASLPVKRRHTSVFKSGRLPISVPSGRVRVDALGGRGFHASGIMPPPHQRQLSHAMKLTKEMKKQIKYERYWHHMFCPTERDDVQDLMLSMVNAVQTFIGSGDFRHQPHNLQSWIVFIGFSFLVLVTTSNYTAQVTTLSVLEQSTSSITSIEQGVERSYRFCGWASMASSIEAAYPNLRGLYIGLPNGHDAFQAMDNDVCDAAIIDEAAWNIAQSGLYSSPEDDPRYAGYPGGAAKWHCETKALLPTVVFQVDIALPVREDLQRALSWKITKSKAEGTWAALNVQAVRKFIPPPACTVRSASSEPSRSLSFWTGAGIVFLSVIMTSLGLVINALWRATPSQRAQRRAWLRAHRRASIVRVAPGAQGA